MEKGKPLVSIVVITYNSSETIVETLDSVKRQTYKNIELVISDDCSTDNTVDIIKTWIDQNKFINAKIVETEINTGVSPNLNRGIKKSSGEWIKILSGDDKLLDNSIQDYIDFVLNTPKCNICFGKFHFWGTNKELVSEVKSVYETLFYPYLRLDNKKQFCRIQRTLFVPGPGLIFKKSLWEKVGGFDERYPFADEYPFTYNVLELGERIYFCNKETYAYQVRENSLCRGKFGLHPRVFKSQYEYIKKSHIKKMISHGYFLMAIHILIVYYRKSLLYKNTNQLFIKLSYILYMFSPYSYYVLLEKIINNNILFKNK